MMRQILFLSLLLITACHSVKTNNSAPTASLENTYWKLLEVNNNAVTTPENVREAHLVLTHDGSEFRLKGFGGCNSFGGSYSHNGDRITFTVVSTKMFCNETMTTENQFFEALNRTTDFKIDGEKMTLYENGKLLARFESVYFK